MSKAKEVKIPRLDASEARTGHHSAMHAAIAKATGQDTILCGWEHGVEGNTPIALSSLPEDTLIALVLKGAQRLAQDAGNSLYNRVKTAHGTVTTDERDAINAYVDARLRLGWQATAKRAASSPSSELDSEILAGLLSAAKDRGLKAATVRDAWKDAGDGARTGVERLVAFYAITAPNVGEETAYAAAEARVSAAREEIERRERARAKAADATGALL